MTRWMPWSLAFLIVVAAVSSTGWYHAAHAVGESQRLADAQLTTDYLRPVTALLADEMRVQSELQTEGYAEQDGRGLLENYLARARQDGVSKTAALKQRIDQLANDNTAILTLLSAYAPHNKTSEFKLQTERFRDFALSFRERWQSTFEIFMAGGTLASAAPPFPTGFASALQAELATYR